MEWETAFQYLQDAIDVAASGDTIHVAQGTYYPDLDGGFNAPAHTLGSRTESLALKPGVIMLGGYIGYNDAFPNTRDPDVYPTILSGDIGTTSVATDNSYHVVTITNATANPVTQLDGFTIRDGFAEDNTSNRRGAGIQISGAGSSPQFLNCIIRDNYARRTTTVSTGSGGGVYSSGTGIGSSIRFTNCDFLNNETGQFGGAAYIASAETVEFTACNFSNNLTSAGSGSLAAGGGAIYITGTSTQAAELNGCFLQDNSTVEGNGGGAFVDGGIILTVRHCDFVGNTSNGGGAAEGQGGGLCVYVPNSVKLIDCDFINNQSNQSQFYSGGGVAVIGSHLSDDYTATIINCRFLGNQTNTANTTGYGGGLVVFKANLNCVNSIFAGNMAERSAGADTSDPDTAYTNCTVAHNVASAANTVGGLQLGGSANDVHNCIVWGNTSNGVGGTNAQISSGVTHNVTYSCIEGGYTGATNISDDPMFVDTSSVDFTLRNYRLQPCSPASDAANDGAVPVDAEDVNENSNTTEDTPDLDLATRIVDNPNRTGSSVDMGAYELAVPECALTGDVNNDTSVDGLDIQEFSDCVLGGGSNCVCADVDLDSIASEMDIPCFVDLLLTGSPCISNCASGQRSFADCNANGVNDKNDIGTGTSLDCNANGIPDECEIDENSTAEGGPWYCESDCATDVNDNGIPDECEDDCNTNGVPDAWDISEETSDDVNTNGVPDECEPDCNTNGIPDAWDISETTSADCNTNGYPDECEDDCNTNGVPDDCDVDPTDPDGDEWVSPDCNEDGYPDECNLSLPPPFGSTDCNTNGIPDECDIADCESDPACDDCNENGIPDSCDIAAEISDDANTNGIPDECEGESLIGGGGESMMSTSGGEGDTGETPVPPSGEGGESEWSEEAAWEAFYDWSTAQCWGPNCETGTDAQFAAMIAKLRELGLPTAAVGP